MQLLPIRHPATDDYRSDYRFDRIGDVLIVIDNDQGRSVTHDAVNVVDELSRSGKLRPTDRLIYRDTMGYWDELVHHDGRFIDFAPIRTQTLGNALERLETRWAPTRPANLPERIMHHRAPVPAGVRQSPCV